MKNYISLKVTCPFNRYKEEKVYYYFGPYNLVFQGCENSCGSKICEECGKENYDKAFQEFEYFCKLYL